MDEMIATYGYVRVVAALLRAALRPRKRHPPWARDLSDHLRRDIGLAPRDKGARDWDPF